MSYTIKSGDSLSKIAARNGLSVAAILALNPTIKNPNKITVGQEIILSQADHNRPTFGGGSRPTENRMNAYTAGMFENFFPWNLDSLWEAISNMDSSTVEKKKTKATTAATPSWMKTAKGEIGVAEYRGMHKANPRIMAYFAASKFWGEDDSSAKNAWCGSFVAWVMKKNGFAPVNNAFRAKEWKNFGKKIKEPIYGAIGIKSRKGGGHVAFIVGKSEDSNRYYMLGGNQKDKVQISEYPASVWETFVVPSGYDASKAELPVYDQAGTTQAGKES